MSGSAFAEYPDQDTPMFGVNSYSKSTSIADTGLARSIASATGGRGTEISGTAEALSIARSNGTALADARANSSGSSRMPASMSSSFSNAKSHASAKAQTAEAKSTANAVGHFTSATASGDVSGNTAHISTKAQTQTYSRAHKAVSELAVDIEGSDDPFLQRATSDFAKAIPATRRAMYELHRFWRATNRHLQCRNWVHLLHNTTSRLELTICLVPPSS